MTPSTAIGFFNDLRDRREINSREHRIALKRWAQTGTQTYIVRDRSKIVFTNEAIGCDCGKGICCPLVKSKPMYK